MREKIIYIYTLLFLATILACAANKALADTQVINNISSSASSGGNSTDGGTIETGDATASVKVENNINTDHEESNEIKVKSEIKLQANEKKYEETIENDEGVDFEKTLTDEDESGNAEAGIEIKTQIMPDNQQMEENVPNANAETAENQNETQQKNLLGKIIDLITSIFK